MPPPSLSRSPALTASAKRKWRLIPQTAPTSLILNDDGPSVDLSEDSDLVNGARPGTPPLHRRQPSFTPTPQEYTAHRRTITQKFPEGWNPPRKISREAMEGLKQLHTLDSATFSVSVLADKFRVSPEAVRRILKSRWEPTKEKKVKILAREKTRREELVQSSSRMKERVEAMNLKQDKRWTQSPNSHSFDLT